MLEKPTRDVVSEAKALKQFVAERFVIVHIDIQFAKSGTQVLKQSEAEKHYGSGIPYIFTVDPRGRYAGHIGTNEAEIRRDTADWYRGYDRVQLLAALKRIHSAAAK